MNFLRYMRTTQERRRFFADANEVRIREARNPRNLPSAWDDFFRHVQRSWKKQRRFKWRKPVSK